MKCVRAVASICSALAVTAAQAQEFPQKPVRLVASEPGGAGDLVARLLAQPLRSANWQVVVDNRAGAFLSGRVVSQAPADGHTLLLAASNLWLQPFLTPNVPWDPVRDFAPITLATTSPLIVVVHPSLPVNSVKELIALAKARPGELNYGSGNNASSSHLGPELFKSMAGVDIVRVAYKGAGPAVVGLAANQVQMMVASAGSTSALLKAGKLKALAITAARPSELVPDLPTLAASGVPGYEFAQTLGLLAPAKTPPPLIARLNQVFGAVLKQPDVKQKLLAAGVEPAPTSPEEFAALIKSDMTMLGKVIKDAGIGIVP